MDTIPIEILIHILSFCIPSKRQRKVRRSLVRVCHFWRTAIYGNPLFWTEVRLHGTTQELNKILHRNPDGPLDVIWTPSNSNKRMDDSGMQRVAMVASHSRRWRSLVLAGPLIHQIRTQLIEIPTPRLVSLNMVESFYGGPAFKFASEGAPLRELTLCRASIDWRSSRLTGLRDLRIHSPRYQTPTLEQLHAILSSSPCLETLDLAGWAFYPSKPPQFKELGALLLPSLITFTADGVPPTFLLMLLFCIQAPGCRNIRLPSIDSSLFQDNDTLEALAKLCQGPFSTVPRLFVSYDRASGSCAITYLDTQLAPRPSSRESVVKLAKHRGVYLQTERIFHSPQTLEAGEAGVRNFIEKVVHPTLRDLSVHIQLDLHLGPPQATDTPSEPPISLITDLLLSVPLVTHLRLHSHPLDVIHFLSSCQPVRTRDGKAEQELTWPIPAMKTLTVACDPVDRAKVFGSLLGLISKRGSHIYHGEAKASGQGDECGECASHPPRYLERIIVKNMNEIAFKVWDRTQGWRDCWPNGLVD